MNEILSENEQLLLNAVSEENLNQRKISRTTGLSLGMTNLLLKKLASRGYIKVVNLNGRTLRYILTPQGMQEKLRKSYDFVLRSVRQVYTIRERVLSVVQSVDVENCEFLVLGENELGVLVKEILTEERVLLTESEWAAGDSQAGRFRCIFLCGMNFELNKDRLRNTVVVDLLSEESPRNGLVNWT